MLEEYSRELSVAIVSPSASRRGGGVSEAVRQHARMLGAEPSFSVQVMALETGRADEEADEDWNGIKLRRFPIIGPRSFGFSPALLRALILAKPDIIHVHGVWQFQCLATDIVSRRYSTPYIVTPHGMLEPWIRRRSPILKGAVSALYQTRMLRRANTIHILTEKERKDVADLVDHPDCRLIPNSVDPFVKPGDLPNWWQDRHDGKDIFLFLGRLHVKKGIVELCEAWAQANACDKDFAENSELVLSGPSDDIPEISKMTQFASGRHGNAQYVGPQFGIEKAQTLGRADFICLPSKSEGLPLVVLEAWAAGVPAIITPECNLESGFLAGAAIQTSTDSGSITRSLIAARRLDRTERHRMRDAAINLIAAQYDPSVTKNALIALYRDLMIKT